MFIHFCRFGISLLVSFIFVRYLDEYSEYVCCSFEDVFNWYVFYDVGHLPLHTIDIHLHNPFASCHSRNCSYLILTYKLPGVHASFKYHETVAYKLAGRQILQRIFVPGQCRLLERTQGLLLEDSTLNSKISHRRICLKLLSLLF